MLKAAFLLISAMIAAPLLQDPKPETMIPVEDLAPTKAGDYDWLARHEAAVERVKKGSVDLLLIGDSITHGWGGEPKQGSGENPLWDKYFGKRNAVNLGFGWDRTQHVIWRLEHGEADGISPKAAMIMIGTNNIGSNSAEDIAKGVGGILDVLKSKCPRTKVLLLAIFPRDEKPADKNRIAVAEANAKISELGKRRGVTFLDIGSKFTGADG